VEDSTNAYDELRTAWFCSLRLILAFASRHCWRWRFSAPLPSTGLMAIARSKASMAGMYLWGERRMKEGVRDKKEGGGASCVAPRDE
jgi:hypothetical protein